MGWMDGQISNYFLRILHTVQLFKIIVERETVQLCPLLVIAL